MALTHPASWAPSDERPAGVPAPPPLRSPAGPLSQGLAAMALVVALAALGARFDSAAWFALPTIALLLGVAIGVQPDARRWFLLAPGIVWSLLTFVVLSVLWVMLSSSASVTVTYAPVPLIAIAVLGADWAWVERLRPTTVASGVGLVPLLDESLDAALPLALVWCAVTAAALWSLRQDAARALPTPGPLTGTQGIEPDLGAGRTAIGLAASWIAAALIVALAGLVVSSFDPPRPEARIDGPDIGAPRIDPPSGGGPAGGLDPAVDANGNGIPDVREGITPETGLTDVDGDGIPDRDIDGDGIPDVDLDGDGIPDIDADGDGVPDVDGGGLTGPDGGSGSERREGGGDLGTVPSDDDGGRSDTPISVARILGLLLLALIVAALVAVAVRAILRERDRRRALAARPWAVRLAERLDQEGAERGRARRRDEPVTRYAAALGDGVLAHDRLDEVGAALSAALFGPAPPSEATAAWAVQVVDEAVEANPPPTWWDEVRARRQQRRARRDDAVD